jgi:hypothetical protein
MNKIIEGAKDALEFMRGEAPAARITINGFAYVPESSLPDHVNELTAHLRAVIQLTKEGGRNIDAFVKDMDEAHIHARVALTLVTRPRQIR